MCVCMCVCVCVCVCVRGEKGGAGEREREIVFERGGERECACVHVSCESEMCVMMIAFITFKSSLVPLFEGL